ncbi:hypothetical protein [Bradyrhizobium sp. RT7b]|uniref:hypothetical protein n=1 Tax=unclassified Bradyrhizobium TaxID=2631580 RepID=UPI00339B1FBA
MQIDYPILRPPGRTASPALVILDVQRGPIASHLTDVVVNGAHQFLAIGEAILPAEDEVVAKPAELGQIGRYRVGPRFFRALTHALLVPSSRRRSVLCLGHDAIEPRRRRESNYRFQRRGMLATAGR